MKCENCNEQTLCGHPRQGLQVCNACFNVLDMTSRRPKKKMGRPVTTTPEQRKEKARQYSKNNPRREYFKKYARKRRYGSTEFKPCYVVKDGEYRNGLGTGRGWTDNINHAKVYQSEGRARQSIQRMGGVGEIQLLDLDTHTKNK